MIDLNQPNQPFKYLNMNELNIPAENQRLTDWTVTKQKLLIAFYEIHDLKVQYHKSNRRTEIKVQNLKLY